MSYFPGFSNLSLCARLPQRDKGSFASYCFVVKGSLAFLIHVYINKQVEAISFLLKGKLHLSEGQWHTPRYLSH